MDDALPDFASPPTKHTPGFTLKTTISDTYIYGNFLSQHKIAAYQRMCLLLPFVIRPISTKY